jgi:capsular exopolysaccharide synthesis family protein
METKPQLPSDSGDADAPLPARRSNGAPPAEASQMTYDDGFVPPPSSGSSLDLRRYLAAALRRKWYLLGALVLGLLAAPVAYRMAPVNYVAEGNIWVEVEQSGGGDLAPIRQAGLLESYAWIELLTSFAVLDPVVVEERLYLSHSSEAEDVFATFTLRDRFAPGSYVFAVSDDGGRYALRSSQGATVEEGAVAAGMAVGAEIGFDWTPEPEALEPATEYSFTVQQPRDAARQLADRLQTRMQSSGNFLGLSLSGTDPERIARILNAVMARHVELAADLKRGRLDEALAILEEQLVYAEQSLAQAEVDLEEFRVSTITLPTDQATPIAPGLAETRGPVFSSFFTMKVEVEQLRQDRERLQELIEELERTGEVSVPALEAIPALSRATELRGLLGELVSARSELRVFRDRYSDDYPPIQELLARIETIEEETIPQLVRGLLAEVDVRIDELQTRIDMASGELEAIPPRTIEEARLSRRVSIQENLYNVLRQRVETARLAAASSIPDVRILDRAEVPRVPAEDERITWAGAAFLGMLALGVGLVFALDWMDSRVRYPDDVSTDMGLEILGSIPRIKAGSGSRARENTLQVLEAFRELRLTLGFAYGAAGPVTIAVTSPSKGEGKSLITTNLAVSFAEVGRRTLLIDGDTRRGDANRLLGLPGSPGLSDYLRQRTGDDIVQSTEYDNLDFIGCGTPGTDTPELLGSYRMAEFFGSLRRAYDVILIDCPPMAAGGDAVILSGLAGSMVVVLRTGSTEKQLASAKLDMLARLPIRILGAILNDVQPRGVYTYYSSYLPDYHPGSDEEESEGRLLAEGREVGAGS